jgi:hypothetical protein
MSHCRALPRRFSAVAAAAMLCVLAGISNAHAACVSLPAQIGNPELTIHDLCVTGALPPNQQAHLIWNSNADGVRSLSFETLPGQLGNMSIVSHADGREIWKGTVTGEGAAESRPLLLVAGEYGITITAGPTGLVYRAEITEPAPLPAELPPAITGEFEGLLGGTGAEIVVSWTVPHADQAGLWTLEIQAPVGAAMTAALHDSAGNPVLYTATANGAGTFRLPDLKLPPGAYTLALYAPPARMPLVAAARFEPRPVTFAFEPDDRPEQAHPLEPGRPATGRLAAPVGSPTTSS